MVIPGKDPKQRVYKKKPKTGSVMRLRSIKITSDALEMTPAEYRASIAKPKKEQTIEVVHLVKSKTPRPIKRKKLKLVPLSELICDEPRDNQNHSHRPNAKAFREQVLNHYGHQCQLCAIAIPEVLDAAHVIDWAKGGIDEVYNALVLCCLHHRLYDAGIICIDERGKVSTQKGPDNSVIRANP